MTSRLDTVFVTTISNPCEIKMIKMANLQNTSFDFVSEEMTYLINQDFSVLHPVLVGLVHGMGGPFGMSNQLAKLEIQQITLMAFLKQFPSI